ncbi:MAG: response regulator, partial [Defluviitaleaceae bacterium]|nr:response regulator [Defluviitaleaceae bacterium]
MDARQKVLIVDDNPMNIRAMVTILQSEYECMVAKSGEDALEVANKSLPDIILLDIIMPDMDGYEVITELKKSEITKNIPVICISGLSDEYHEEQGLVLGAADYIHKENSAAIIKLRVKKQLQLMNALKEAEEASRAKSDFLAKMSHEIRTPMNSVIGITSIQLQKGGHTPETENAFLQIRSSSDMLLALINDILDLSKVEAGKMEVFPKAYETASLISDTVQLNLTHMERKNILFKLEIDENLPRMLIGDVIRVKQVFNNLLSNAFKYTDEGEVKFSVTFNENALFVNVADTGHGMTSEQVDALFGNEYIRFNEQGRRHIEGTGLGLNISHRLVSAMGGEISVESERGKGSTFRVKLLQGIEDATVLGKESADNLNNFRFVRGDSKRQQYFEYEPMPYGKVLVVDDLESNLYVAMGLMEPYALTVETASSAKEAIELVKDGEIYDVIFMDHMMPEMNGIEATKIIRDTGYLKPIVALTANIVAGQSNLFDNNGFDGFISKPIDVNILNSYL